MSRCILLSMLVLLAACQGAALQSPVPVGSVLELHQPLTIPAGRSNIHFQDNGLRGTGGGINQYAPNCRLVLRARAEVPRQVQPDRFTIRRVQHHVEGLLAGLGAGVMLFDGNGSSHATYITDFYLHSEHQPEVVRLSCQQWQDPAYDRFPSHVTLDEVRGALGARFTLSTAPGT